MVKIINSNVLIMQSVLTCLIFAAEAVGLMRTENAEIQLACPLIDQITSEILGASEQQSINADCTRIAFILHADISGSNPDGNDEVYLFYTINY